MGNNKLSFSFKNNYFDFRSFGEEIKPYIDDSVFLELEKQTKKSINVYFQKNTAHLKDDLI